MGVHGGGHERYLMSVAARGFGFFVMESEEGEGVRDDERRTMQDKKKIASAVTVCGTLLV